MSGGLLYINMLRNFVTLVHGALVVISQHKANLDQNKPFIFWYIPSLFLV